MLIKSRSFQAFKKLNPIEPVIIILTHSCIDPIQQDGQVSVCGQFLSKLQYSTAETFETNCQNIV